MRSLSILLNTAGSALALLAAASLHSVHAINNGVGRTPAMGWNTWGQFHCSFDENLIHAVADAMVSTGLRDAGYVYLNLDDCWMAPNRDANGRIQGDPAKFPSGMKALGDYLHARGLKFGVYSSAGFTTCQGLPASFGNEDIDAETFASWGVDFLKYDNCNYFLPGQNDVGVIFDYLPPNGESVRFPAMRDALNATGRPIYYSICNWGQERPYEWAMDVANSFRTAGDIAAYFHGTFGRNDTNTTFDITIFPPVSNLPLPSAFSSLPEWVQSGVIAGLGGVTNLINLFEQLTQSLLLSLVVPAFQDLFSGLDKEIVANGSGLYDISVLELCYCVTADCHNPGIPNFSFNFSSDALGWPLSSFFHYDLAFSTNNWYIWGGNCSVLNIVDRTASIPTGVDGPGNFMDLDHLVVGVNNPHYGSLKYNQSVAHFSVWCIMKSPLIMTLDVTSITSSDLAILSNREAIAINQDPLGIAAVRVARQTLSRLGAPVDTFVAPLADGSYAVVIINRRLQQATASIAWADFSNWSWSAYQQAPIRGASFATATVRDIWNNATHPSVATSFSVVLSGDSAVFLRVTPK